MTRKEIRRRRQFARYASPACILFGVASGLIYAVLIYKGLQALAFFGFAVTLSISGILGGAYFEYRALYKPRLPFLMEQIRFFYFLFFGAGISYFLRATAGIEVPSYSLHAAFAYWFTGAIAGTVLAMGVTLFIGIRHEVASWHVIRFPVWIGLAIRWGAKKGGLWKSN